MRERNPLSRLGVICTLTGLLLITACQEYEVEVVVDPEGGGSRSITLAVDGELSEESEPTLAQPLAIFALQEDRGWRLESREELERAIGPFQRRHVTRFTREAEAADAASWRDLSGDIRVIGSPDEPEIGMRNEISVWHSTGTVRSLSYRETFIWTGLLEALLEYQAEHFVKLLDAEFPTLGTEELAELRGLIKGFSLYHLRLELDEDTEDEGEQLTRLVDAYTLEIVRRAAPTAEAEAVAGIVHQAIFDPEGGAIDHLFEEKYPGIGMATLTEVTLRVTMPGTLADHNADEVTGNTAIWRFDIFNALLAPLDVYVRAELPN